MIMRLWRGEVALWRTFWLAGAGGGALLGIPLFAALLALTDVPDDATASVFLAALALLLVYTVWAFVGTWRAAGSYPGQAHWALMARLFVAAGTATVLALSAAVLFADRG